MTIKLDAGQKHLLRLVAEGADAEGWAPVSKPVFPLVEKLPGKLVELEAVGDEGRGRVRLTPAGESLLDAMAWL
jgi:hypothetical protein